MHFPLPTFKFLPNIISKKDKFNASIQAFHLLLQSVTHALPSLNPIPNLKFLKLNNHNRNGTELQAESTMAVMALSVLAAVFVFIFLHLFESLFLKPKRLRSKLLKQGIDGPSPSFLLGNLPEIKNIRALKSHALTTTEGNDSIAHGWPSNLLPHLEHWRNRYGISPQKTIEKYGSLMKRVTR
ncbi:unnamed protein product [Citrullus colocynthis]|uniref:Cytochrome P450 n=1 Tax=Citrullus colocynthis TaxID=252529 RepID=A0ABP0Z959_9ROSI